MITSNDFNDGNRTVNDFGLNQTSVEERINYIPITILECRKLSFWCDQLLPQKEKCCITHLSGLPRHPATLIQMPFTPYQIEFKDIADKNPKKRFHVNKARQTGFSEIVLRVFQERSFKQYSTKAIKYVVGTREITTKKMIRRLKDLYRKIPDVLENNEDKLHFELKDGTSFEGLPSSSEALTGDTKIAALAMDEAAKWNREDDQEILNAYLPIVNASKSDFFMFSTPKGPRGFFYNLDEGIDRDNDYIKYRYDIWATEGNLYTKEEIEVMLADRAMDIDQEYLNKYTTGRDSIWGEVTEEHRSDEEEMEL